MNFDVCKHILKWAQSNYPKGIDTKGTVNLNASLAAEGWELMQIIPPPNSALNTKLTEAIFRRK